VLSSTPWVDAAGRERAPRGTRLRDADAERPGPAAALLLLRATSDPFASPQAAVLCAHLQGARIVDLPGGGVSLPDQMPAVFARVVEAFLRGDPD
jgi:pimeloyl-ACP methyl ester carboxylesterase